MKKNVLAILLTTSFCGASFATELPSTNLVGLELSTYSLLSAKPSNVLDIASKLNYEQLNNKLLKLGYSISHEKSQMTNNQFLYKVEKNSKEQVSMIPKTFSLGYTVNLSNIESVGQQHLFDFSSNVRSLENKDDSLFNGNSVQSPSILINSYEKYNVWLNEKNNYMFVYSTQSQIFDGRYSTTIFVVSTK